MYDDFAATYGRRHLSLEQYEHRKDNFHRNRVFIEDWNAQANEKDSHMLKLNHFADWSEVSLAIAKLLAAQLCFVDCDHAGTARQDSNKLMSHSSPWPLQTRLYASP